MINSAGDFGPMLFGTGERLLLPFGLHHILVALIRFYRRRRHAGSLWSNRQRCTDHLPCAIELPNHSRFFLKAPRVSFRKVKCLRFSAVCRAALAMYHCARPENRHKIKGLLISGLIACRWRHDRTAGIPVPVRSASSVCHPRAVNRPRLHCHVQCSASPSVIPTAISSTLWCSVFCGLSTKWYMVPVVAAIWFVVYYIIFRSAITRFNLKTPGAIVKLPVQSKSRCRCAG